jgi:hypothetical protein
MKFNILKYHEHTYKFYLNVYFVWLSFLNWGSSVSIVFDYRLDDRDSIPGRGKGFSCSFCILSDSHPASCTMGTGGPFPEAKTRPGRDADHLPHLVPRSRMSGSYISSPPWRAHGGSGTSPMPFRVRYAVFCVMLWSQMPCDKLNPHPHLLSTETVQCHLIEKKQVRVLYHFKTEDTHCHTEKPCTTGQQVCLRNAEFDISWERFYVVFHIFFWERRAGQLKYIS